MTRGDRLRDASRRWLSAAQDDLDAARLVIEGGCACNIACFHAQQAAEKSIKAAYVHEDAEFQFSHDLDLLRNERSSKRL